MKDKAGVEIQPGDFIVYGHALGRCAGLRYGIVKAITPGKKSCRVRGYNDDFEGLCNELASKDGTLLFGSRILVVSPDLMPPKVVCDLHDHYCEFVKTLKAT